MVVYGFYGFWGRRIHFWCRFNHSINILTKYPRWLPFVALKSQLQKLQLTKSLVNVYWNVAIRVSQVMQQQLQQMQQHCGGSITDAVCAASSFGERLLFRNDWHTFLIMRSLSDDIKKNLDVLRNALTETHDARDRSQRSREWCWNAAADQQSSWETRNRHDRLLGIISGDVGSFSPE